MSKNLTLQCTELKPYIKQENVVFNKGLNCKILRINFL